MFPFLTTNFSYNFFFFQTSEGFRNFKVSPFSHRSFLNGFSTEVPNYYFFSKPFETFSLGLPGVQTIINQVNGTCLMNYSEWNYVVVEVSQNQTQLLMCTGRRRVEIIRKDFPRKMISEKFHPERRIKGSW